MRLEDLQKLRQRVAHDLFKQESASDIELAVYVEKLMIQEKGTNTQVEMQDTCLSTVCRNRQP